MAADHGVVAEGVSKYRRKLQSRWFTTSCTVEGYQRSLRVANALVVVVDMGVCGRDRRSTTDGSFFSKRIGAGTRNCGEGPAMSLGRSGAVG